MDRRVAPLGLTVDDALTRLAGVRLLSLGGPAPAATDLWRLPDGYQPAQQEILDVLPALPVPKLSLKPAVKRRLTNARRGRSAPRK